MYSNEWLLAFQIQVAIAICSLIIARLWLDIPWGTALLAISFGNAIPVMEFPGFAAWLYLQDFMVLLLLGSLILSLSIRWTTMGGLTALTLLVWPGLATTLTVFLGIPEGYAWAAFLYRRFAMVVLVIALAGGSWNKVRASDFLDMWLLIWGGMCVFALFHYFGFVNLDFFRGLEKGLASIEEGAAAQRGFLGISRAGTGVLGSTAFAYCLALLLFDPQLGSRRTLLCMTTGTLSFVVVLFSGSRTGFIACMMAVAYLGFRSLQLVRNVRVGRILLGGAFAGILLTGVVARGLDVVRTRLQLREGFQSEGFHARTITQRSLLKVASTNPHVGLVGLGGGTSAHFRFLVGGLSHAHNDYLQFLWEGGFPGFVFFLAWLFMLFRAMQPKNGGYMHVLGIGGQAMMLAGLVMGMAEGHLAAFSTRMIAPSILVLITYCLIARDIKLASQVHSEPDLCVEEVSS